MPLPSSLRGSKGSGSGCARSSSSIPTAAYLVKDGYSIKFSNQPGDTALVTYTIKNIGNTVQNNVSFNLLKLDGGFTLTTTAFLNVGNILPGQSKQVAYQFIAPSTDTIGSYDIEVNADNGSYTDVSGVLFTVLPAEVTSIANGLWSSTSTWSNNRVPGAASNVTIKHNVTVDINASCKSINVSASGELTVSTGITLNVLK